MRKAIILTLVLACIALFAVACQPAQPQAGRAIGMEWNPSAGLEPPAPAPYPGGEIYDPSRMGIISAPMPEPPMPVPGEDIGIYEWVEDPPGSGQWKLIDKTAASYISPENLLPGQVISVRVSPELIDALSAQTAGVMPAENQIRAFSMTISAKNKRTNEPVTITYDWPVGIGIYDEDGNLLEFYY